MFHEGFISVFRAVMFWVRQEGTQTLVPWAFPLVKFWRACPSASEESDESGLHESQAKFNLLQLWSSVLWTSCRGSALKFVRNTASGAQPRPSASDPLLGGGGMTICILISIQVEEAPQTWENGLSWLGMTREHGQPQGAVLRVRVETIETVNQPELSPFLFTNLNRRSYFFTLKSQGLQGTEKQDGSIPGISSHMSIWPPSSLTRCLCPSLHKCTWGTPVATV